MLKWRTPRGGCRPGVLPSRRAGGSRAAVPAGGHSPGGSGSRPRGVGAAPGCGCLHPAGAHCRPRRAAAESPGAESTQTSCSCERRPTAAQPRTCVARAVAGNSCSWRSWRLAAALHAASVESCCARHAVCRACLAINARRCHATCHMYFVSVMCVCTRHSAVCVIGDECVECKLLACGASYSSPRVHSSELTFATMVEHILLWL